MPVTIVWFEIVMTVLVLIVYRRRFLTMLRRYVPSEPAGGFLSASPSWW
ncbi:hypothetical protein [Corynebacterium sp. CCM 9204]